MQKIEVNAEAVGFEPTKPVRVPVFETGAIVHYATPPELNASLCY